jgi:hypothetical protein
MQATDAKGEERVDRIDFQRQQRTQHRRQHTHGRRRDDDPPPLLERVRVSMPSCDRRLPSAIYARPEPPTMTAESEVMR